MIAVDTNVLLRHLLNDDAVKSPKARKIFEKYDQILITDVVLVETVWTLTGKRYKASKENIARMITALLEEPSVVFESQPAVWAALNDYMNAPIVKTSNGNRSADFPEALVIHKARILAELWGESNGATYTFDLAAQALVGARAP